LRDDQVSALPECLAVTRGGPAEDPAQVLDLGVAAHENA
jgi:hypothetical protein